MRKQGRIYTGIGLLLLAAALVLCVYNLWSDISARKAADAVLEKLNSDIPTRSADGFSQESYIPDYILNPNMDMPEDEIDGRKYIGVLHIPALSLRLPILSAWSYPNLRVAPCRYAGSAYLNNLVIAAHNYQSHFGKLKNLSQGDEVTFTDVDGNVFFYQVVEMETLSPYATEEMTVGDWDLTLFTCTIGGQRRVTVRCEQSERGDSFTSGIR